MEIKDRYTLKDKLKAMGPGILVVGSFIGPGTVTSATKAGAGYGYALLGQWYSLSSPSSSCRRWPPGWVS